MTWLFVCGLPSQDPDLCSPILIMSPVAQGEVDHYKSVGPAEVRIMQNINIKPKHLNLEKPLTYGSKVLTLS